jgi:hypothetical protein
MERGGAQVASLRRAGSLRREGHRLHGKAEREVPEEARGEDLAPRRAAAVLEAERHLGERRGPPGRSRQERGGAGATVRRRQRPVRWGRRRVASDRRREKGVGRAQARRAHALRQRDAIERKGQRAPKLGLPPQRIVARGDEQVGTG